MSSSLWERLPPGLLKMKYRTWVRLERGVKLLIIELANSQKFKCAFCSKNQDLIVEHDHEPDEGPSDRYTIHNVRGLVCQRCNWHLGLYETDERGGHRGWDHVTLTIRRGEYEEYVYVFGCRLRRLLEEALEKTCPNYWSRRLFIDKFDEWKDGYGHYPWYWGFEEIKEKRHGKIRTPKQFFRTLAACLKFIEEETKKNPNYQPPDAFLQVLVQVETLLESVRPIVDSRLRIAKQV